MAHLAGAFDVQKDMLYWVLWYFVPYGIMPLFILGLTLTLAMRDFSWIVNGSELIKNLIRKLF